MCETRYDVFRYTGRVPPEIEDYLMGNAVPKEEYRR